MSPTRSSRRTPFHCTLPGILLVVAAYALTHATTRLLASGNLGEDDVLDTLLIQQLLPGYSVERGPLYDWAMWLVQHVAGTGLGGFLLLKYSLLVAMAGALFLVTRRLTGSALWAFLAVESMATVYQIFWRFHEGFTHRVGAMALVALTLLAAFRLVDRQRWRDYALFALLVGLGLLSEHIYAYFLATLFLTAAFQPELRRRLFSPRLLAMLPITAAVIAPYALWLLASPERGSEFLVELIPTRDAPNLAASLRDALTFPVFVLSPYILIVLATFPGIFKAAWRRRGPGPKNSPFDLQRWLGQILALELAGHLLANGVIFAQANYPVHSILPMLVITIPWLTATAHDSAPSPKRVTVFMLILLAFTATAYGVRSGNLFVYEPFCSRCRWGTPYEDLAGRLRDMGIDRGTIVTNDVHTGGNLRRFLPSANIVLVGREARAGTPPQPGERRVLLWLDNDTPPALPADLQATVPAGTVVAPAVVRLPWHPPLKKPGYRHTTWAVAIID